MRKIITIGGNDVAFECNAVTPILYKSEFGKDYMAEMLQLSSAMDVLKDPKNADSKDFEKLDFDIFSRLAWALAKSADKNNTKGYIDWLWENKEFSAIEHATTIFDLVRQNFETKKN